MRAGWRKARQGLALTGMDVRTLHRRVMLRSMPDLAGRYADQGRYVLTDGGRISFPSLAELPALMGDFASWRVRRIRRRVLSQRTCGW
jgi:hypothetical protein